MSNNDEPLDLSLDDLLTDEVDAQQTNFTQADPPAPVQRTEPAKPTASVPRRNPGLHANAPQGRPPARRKEDKLGSSKGQNAVQYQLNKALHDEFYRIMPELMDEALDHIVENLPKVINERMTTRLMDYLLENKKKILDEAVRDLIRK